MVFITITLLINVTLITSLAKAPSNQETKYGGVSNHIPTPSQSAGEGVASNSIQPKGDPKRFNSATTSSVNERANSHMFNFDSFAKVLNSQKTEELQSLAQVDADSAELVIGLDGQPSLSFCSLAPNRPTSSD